MPSSNEELVNKTRNGEISIPEDLDEVQWLESASKNTVFDFLEHDDENIYAPQDGSTLIKNDIRKCR